MKSLDKVIQDLIELGLTERKIANILKKTKSEIEVENLDNSNSKKFNRLINGMLFDGLFFIVQPTPALLGLTKQMKKLYSSEFIYYLLYQIYSNEYLYNEIHQKDDIEKSNRLMYLLRDKTRKYYLDFKATQKKCPMPFEGV